LLADLILVIHFGIAFFITAGLVLIPLGALLNWRWVRRRGWRITHLAAIVFVAGEALAGIACPLTVWEDLLRGGAVVEAGFIQRWLGRLLYWQAPAWFFTALYVTAAALAVWLWVRVRPTH